MNAVVPVAATAMTKTIPAFAPIVEESSGPGSRCPHWLRRDEGFGTAEDVAGLVVFLASDAVRRASPGQAIGIGGDRLALWSHPGEKAVGLRRRRLDAPTRSPPSWRYGASARDPETYGIPAPKVPGPKTAES